MRALRIPAGVTRQPQLLDTEKVVRLRRVCNRLLVRATFAESMIKDLKREVERLKRPSPPALVFKGKTMGEYIREAQRQQPDATGKGTDTRAPAEAIPQSSDAPATSAG